MEAAEIQAAINRVTAELPGCRPYENRRPLNVPGRFDGESLQSFLGARHRHLPMAYWAESAAAGRLLRRGERLNLETRLLGGDELVHVVPETVEPTVSAAIRVLYADPEIVVVLKPAPLPVHPCGRYNRNTLTWLLEEALGGAGVRPRLVHRLDANTAGVMVLALTRAAARCLQAQFADGLVRKLYLAEVSGEAPAASFCCHAAIGKNPVAVGGRLPDDAGLRAESRFRTLRSHAGLSLVAAVPVTGRTNQLRAHLWHLGLPVVGDPFYLPRGEIGDGQTLAVGAPKMRLQAVSLRFRHPGSGQARVFRALPDWLGEAGG